MLQITYYNNLIKDRNENIFVIFIYYINYFIIFLHKINNLILHNINIAHNKLRTSRDFKIREILD